MCCSHATEGCVIVLAVWTRSVVFCVMSYSAISNLMGNDFIGPKLMRCI